MKKILIILLSLIMTSCCSVKLQDINAWGKVEKCRQTDREVAYKNKIRISPDFALIIYTNEPLTPGDSIIIHNILKIEK